MARIDDPISKILGVKTNQPAQTAIQANKPEEENPLKKQTLPMVAYNTSFVGGLDKVSVFNAQSNENV